MVEMESGHLGWRWSQSHLVEMESGHLVEMESGYMVEMESGHIVERSGL